VVAFRPYRINEAISEWIRNPQPKDTSLIELGPRYRIHLLDCAIATCREYRDAPVGSIFVGIPDVGPAVQIEVRDDGKVLVLILSNRDGVAAEAAFSFKPNHTSNSEDPAPVTDLMWESVLMRAPVVAEGVMDRLDP